MTLIKIADSLPAGIPTEHNDQEKGIEWWIVEVKDYGRTAMPSKELAINGADVIRSWGTVRKIRKADFADTGDNLAIVACITEIQEEIQKKALAIFKQ